MRLHDKITKLVSSTRHIGTFFVSRVCTIEQLSFHSGNIPGIETRALSSREPDKKRGRNERKSKAAKEFHVAVARARR